MMDKEKFIEKINKFHPVKIDLKNRELSSAVLINHYLFAATLLGFIGVVITHGFSSNIITSAKLLCISLLCLINFFAIRKRWYVFFKINLIFFPVFIYYIAPILLGHTNISDYFLYQYSLIVIATIPSVILNYEKDKILLGISFLYYFFLIFSINWMISSYSTETFPLTETVKDFHFTFFIIPVILYMFIQFTVFYVIYSHNQHHSKLIQSSQEISFQNMNLAKKNSEIEIQKNTLLRQKELIDSQKKIITDSISSAKQIQRSILPSDEKMDSLLDNYFIYDKPKDIVSGDFYWAAEKDGCIFVAVADCTGHGVPGAFISLLGVSILNEAFRKHSNLPMGSFMNEIRENIIISLHQTSKPEDIKMGMDMSLLKIDPANKQISFAGANHNLYFVRDGEFEQIRGDRMPVSVNIGKYDSFHTYNLDYTQGDTLYMLSDGLPDQFGGENTKKFGYPRFKKLLTEMQDQTMKQQYITIARTLEEWQGGMEQIDDMLVMGIRL